MSAGRTTNAKNKHWGTPPKYVNVINLMFDNNIEF